MEHAAISSDSIGDVLAQLGLERLHPPGVALEKKRGDLTCHLPVSRDDDSSPNIVVR
jgi:hypothetical protein